MMSWVLLLLLPCLAAATLQSFLNPVVVEAKIDQLYTRNVGQE